MSRRKGTPDEPTLPFADADPLRLADGQRKALDLRSNRVISASAGTGKTYTLTALYVALLEGRLKPGEQLLDESAWLARVQQGERGLRPSQIVAVTFTKKAAAELLHRARKAVDDERHRAGLPEPLREHLHRCWEELPGAPIATIDSFCARLLREAGARSPAPAAFSVLEQDEADELLRKALLDAAAARLQQNKNPDFRFLARQWGVLSRNGIVAVGAGLLSVLRTRGLEPAALRTPPDKRLGDSAIRERVLEFLSALGNARAVKGSKPAADLIALCADPPPLRSVEDIRRLLLTVSPRLYTGNGLYKWAQAANITDPAPELLVSLHAPLAGALAAYLEDAAARYSRAKRQAGGVDFNDLLIFARELVGTRGGASPYALVLIDEYQDTNRLQNDVLKGVAYGGTESFDGGTKSPAHHGRGDSQSRPVRLAVVGDRKQSIYRFRGADVSLMEAAEQDGSFAVAPLAQTFRSREKLIAFLNAFFRHMWPPGSGFEYGEAHALAAAPHPDRHAWDGPAGEVMELHDGEAAKAEQHRWQQARAIAARIRCLVSPKGGLVQPRVWDKTEQKLREPRYGDIAILARSIKNIRVPLQLALAQMGIPFRMLGGLSFYTRPEVLDAGNLLACALQPCDDLALAGLLRSPFVGLSDGGLWRLQALARDLKGLYQKLVAAAADPAQAGFNSDDAAALRQADGLLAALRAGCGRRTAAELIDAACRMTGFLGVLALQPQGDVAVASVRRVIELSRSFEAKGVPHLSDFVRWLREKADAEWSDPGKEGDPGLEFTLASGDTFNSDHVPDAVQIGTIHSAKGLEFPIVIIADIGAGPRATTDAALYLPDTGLGLKLGIEQEGLGAAADAVHKAAHDAEKTADSAERCRLLYVALTRARDYLILIGENVSGTKRDTSNWRNLVMSFRQDHPGVLETVHYYHPELRQARPEQSHALLVFEGQSATLRDGASGDTFNSEHVPAVALLQGLAAPGVERLARRDIRLSVSALARCLDCPRRVALSQWMGEDGGGVRPITDDEVEPPEPDDTEEGPPQARALGIAAHAVLEAVFSGATGRIEDVWAAAAGGAGIPGTRSTSNMSPAAEVVRAVKALVASEWGRAILKLPLRDRFVEKPFRVRIVVDANSGSTVTLTGKMDLLVSPARGRWQVFDYKVAARPASGETLTRYGWQALLYGIAAGRVLNAAEPAEPALIFLRDDPPRPLTLRELGFPAKATDDVLQAALRAAWESAEQLDPMQQPAQAWLPGADAPAARDCGRCRRDGCPFVERCYGVT